MDSSIISIIIVLITMGLFVWNRLPISVVAILGSVAMAMFIPEMDLSAVYSGFSATGWPMVVGMCVVSAALFETGIARKIGEKIGNSFLAKTERRFIVTVSAVCSLMSAFMSNNGTVAIWMPIIAIVAANSCGKIRSKMVIFPAGTAAIIGGACSLIGSTSQLAANSVLQGYAGYEEGMGMFDMTKIMFPAAVVQIIFWGTIGYKLLDKVLKPDSPDFDKGNMYSVAEIHKLEKEQESAAPAWKGYVALGTMILCIVLFVLSGFQPFKSYFNIGTIGLIGAAMVLGTGCISIKKAYSDLPWDVFVCIGTISGIGTGLDVSGGINRKRCTQPLRRKERIGCASYSSYRSAYKCAHEYHVKQRNSSNAYTNLYSNCIIAWNQSYSMGNRNRCLLKPCNSNIFRNSCKYADTSGRIQVFGFRKNRWTVTYNTYCSCFYMQCGIPVLRIECPEAQIFASTPNNKSVWKVCVHNKTDTNKTNRAIIYDSSVCGYEHPGSNSFNNTITERKNE